MKNITVQLQKFFKGTMALLICLVLSHLACPHLFAQGETIMAVPADINSGKWALVIHGGAGGPARGTMPAEKEKEYMLKLDEALNIGSEILASGGSSLDAIEKVIRFMEDCPLFNAGVGAVLNEDGKAEHDAAVMDGRTGKAGAVGGVTVIKNPVSAARQVMEQSPHVLLVGPGAEKFAKSMGLEIVAPAYFVTPERLKAWEKWKAAGTSNPEKKPDSPEKSSTDKEKHGTVGAVALDQQGNLAAGTSTGGMMGKMTGRIGDTPIIGAGTYASNQTCAVSATGHGEYFMRNVVAYDLSAMMEYRGMSVEEAGSVIIMEKLQNQKGSGGLIAVDKEGNICMPFNTNAMFRGFMKSGGEREVAIY